MMHDAGVLLHTQSSLAMLISFAPWMGLLKTRTVLMTQPTKATLAASCRAAQLHNTSSLRHDYAGMRALGYTKHRIE